LHNFTLGEKKEQGHPIVAFNLKEIIIVLSKTRVDLACISQVNKENKIPLLNKFIISSSIINNSYSINESQT
jgi:hypothetical protein